MILSCPSKTFLLGEYLVLNGGPSLLLGTEPRFELRVQRGAGKSPFHPESPAGKLWARFSNITGHWSAEFVNPSALGGLGASGAEFLLLYSAIKASQAVSIEAQLEQDHSEMLQLYWELSSQTGARPSGADLVAQARGGVTLFERSQGRLESTSWGFPNLGFILFSTGHKTPTHEHLRSLGEWDSSALENLTRQALQAHRIKHEQNFVDSVRKVRETLKFLGFEAPTTTKIIDELSKAPSIRAIKGCGALGADVICALVDDKDLVRISELLSRKYTIIANHHHLSEGLFFKSTHVLEAQP